MDLKVGGNDEVYSETENAYDSDVRRIVRRGTATTGEQTLDFSKIDPGAYTLEICPQDSTAAKAETNLYVYDTKVNVTPDGEMIWTPDTRLDDGILTLGVNGNKDIHVFLPPKRHARHPPIQGRMAPRQPLQHSRR